MGSLSRVPPPRVPRYECRPPLQDRPDQPVKLRPSPTLPTPSWRVAWKLAAPIAGSAWLFPRRLERALAHPDREAALAAISGTEARWFFGPRLTFWTDPGDLLLRLENRVEDGKQAFWLSDRFVEGSDWTEITMPEARLAEHREMIELVQHRTAYSSMPSFRQLMRRSTGRRPSRRYGDLMNSEDKIHTYFRHYLQLIETIERDGYRDRYSLGAWKVPGTAKLQERTGHHKRNIGVAIGPDGTLLRFLGGRHRTAIAQALKLPSVPVEIRLVHAAWLIGEVERSGLPPAQALLAWAGLRRPRLREEAQ
jgi:hypothetical protein